MRRILVMVLSLCIIFSVSSISVWADEGEGWQTGMMLPVSMSGASICAVGDKLYVIGGSSSTVQIYNTKTDTWKFGAAMPDGIKASSAVAIGSKLYVEPSGNSPVQWMSVYDTTKDSWDALEGVGGLGQMVAVGDKIYGIGTGRDRNNKYVMVVSIYDTTTGKITSGSQYANGVINFYTSIKDNKIYVAGGGNDNRNSVDTLYIYDIEMNTWSRGTRLRIPREKSVSAIAGNKLYVIGGIQENGLGYLNSVEIYDIETGIWSAGPPISAKQQSVCAGATGDRIYVVLGNRLEYLQVENSSNVDYKLSVLLNVGESVQLSISNSLLDNANFTWSSTAESVATVDENGKVTAVALGQTDIYAESADGSFREYIPVKVVEGTADEMRLAVHLNVSEKAKLFITDDEGDITWSSLDESVATASEKGEVTAVSKGLAIIKGELEGNIYQIYIRVNDELERD